MKIKKIKLYQFNRPFRTRFHSSQTLRTKAESIVIQLEFENGISGYGESAPRTYVTGENTSAVARVTQNCFAPILLSHTFESIDDVGGVLNELENECQKRNILQYNAALGGIDIALLDGLGKLQKLPAANFIGSTVRKKIPYSIPIPFLPHQKIRDLFSQLYDFNFHHVKVLLRQVESENIERVSLVRSLFGDHVDIRVDVNEGWTFRQALSNLERLEKFNITAVEQPLPKEDIENLVRLRRAIGIPIIVDEGMCCLADARMLIERDACDILNIKISKCGGLLRSKEIASFAHSEGIRCQLGSHVGETDILSAAGRCFASTTQNLAYVEGCSFLLFEDLSGKKQLQIKSINEGEFSNSGLGIGGGSLQLIKKHCSPILELHSKFQSR